MTSCNHNKLVLLPEKKNRMRCRRCYLIIKADELGKGYCPECYETDGSKLYDFEEMAEADTGIARYRCEACGLIIESV